jgi:uncharacterized protein
MKLLMDNLPPSLNAERESIRKCIEAMDSVMPIRAVYLFGSHARGDARPDSDVDLCIVTDEAKQQIIASKRLSEALLDVWPRPSLTLIPITPERLAEKQAARDHFFQTVMTEGVSLATEDRLE